MANEALGENFTMRGCQIILVRIRRWIHNPFCIFLYPRNDSPRSNDFNSDLGFRTDSKSLQTMILWSNGRSISISFSHRVELIVNSFLIISRELEEGPFFLSRKNVRLIIGRNCGRIARLWLLRTRGTRFLVRS